MIFFYDKFFINFFIKKIDFIYIIIEYYNNMSSITIKPKNNNLLNTDLLIKYKNNAKKSKLINLDKSETKENNTEENKSEIIDKDTKNIRLEGLDKFYTIKPYAKKCIDKVFELYETKKWDLIIEPSAGNGSFYLQIPNKNKIGIDIAPEHESIIKQDFLKYTPPVVNSNILVIGNPPFGKICSLAIKFFNHSAQWSNVIAFIIPRTFRKISVQNKLDDMFHLVYDEDVPITPCYFSPPMMVKCCFQVWEKRNIKRNVVELPKKHNDWNFLSFGPLDENKQPTPPQGSDFALRAYGGKIGEIKLNDLDKLRPKSWHWIKSNIDKTELIEKFKQLDYSNSLNTARQNSMGRSELVILYTNFINPKI